MGTNILKGAGPYSNFVDAITDCDKSWVQEEITSYKLPFYKSVSKSGKIRSSYDRMYLLTDVILRTVII